MGSRRIKPRNVAGLISKLRVIAAAQDLKISYYMQILVPPYFWLVPSHFVCCGDGTVENAYELVTFTGIAFTRIILDPFSVTIVHFW